MTPSEYNTIFTVGHSDHTIERFIELLHCSGISAIADVRSMPYSRFNPQFNREQLHAGHKAARIRYVFLGDELGARRAEPECYVEGKARYELIARTPGFHAGLRRLQEGSQSYRVALLCAEKDPVTCHRAILVCRHLQPLGLTISHILGDGRTETHAEMENRLLKTVGLDQDELSSGRTLAIERAYDIQGDRIAYIRNGVTAEARGGQ